jgi:ferritin-like metal-binding protein YciE
MNMKSIEDVFIHLLGYLQRRKTINPRPGETRQSGVQRTAERRVQGHLEETQGQIERIDQIVEQEPDIKIKRMKCVAMEGLLKKLTKLLRARKKMKCGCGINCRCAKLSIMKLPATALSPL